MVKRIPIIDINTGKVIKDLQKIKQNKKTKPKWPKRLLFAEQPIFSEQGGRNPGYYVELFKDTYEGKVQYHVVAGDERGVLETETFDNERDAEYFFHNLVTVYSRYGSALE